MGISALGVRSGSLTPADISWTSTSAADVGTLAFRSIHAREKTAMGRKDDQTEPSDDDRKYDGDAPHRR